MPSPSDSLAGGCLCSAVRYTYKGPLGGGLGAVTACHCSQCRKGQGYASAVAPILAMGFEVTSGGAFITEYESSPGKTRAFCGVCGSPIYSRRNSLPDIMRLRLGSLDHPPESLTLDAHIYTEGAPKWAEPSDAPRYPGLEPERP